MIDALISRLTSQLGITEEQASEGAGALLTMAKDRLGEDFSQIAEGLPGIDELMAKAPSAGETEGATEGLLGAAAGILGENTALLSKLDDLARLADTFLGLGLDADQIASVGQIVLEFVREHVGDDAAERLKGLIA